RRAASPARRASRGTALRASSARGPTAASLAVSVDAPCQVVAVGVPASPVRGAERAGAAPAAAGGRAPASDARARAAHSGAPAADGRRAGRALARARLRGPARWRARLAVGARGRARRARGARAVGSGDSGAGEVAIPGLAPDPAARL